MSAYRGATSMSKLVRVIVHWTAGSYTVNATDKEHYHFIVNGAGNVVVGDLPPEANISTSDGDGYAAHTRGANTGAIGVSIACMAGAVESPFNPGQYPLTKVQWDAMIKQVAVLCAKYDIPVTKQSVLTHAEVEGTLGIEQAGKWDITRLPFDDTVRGATEVGDKMRREVVAALKPQAKPDTPLYVTRRELAEIFRRMARELDGG
jgi:N-acetyl-anhydromuramyl-L-alanine amidase AmpD